MSVNEQLKSGTVLVKFGAPWCMPCKQLEPILQEIAQIHSDRLSYVDINVDQNGDIASSYNVRGVPAILVLKDGAEVARMPNAGSPPMVRKFVNDAIS